MHENWDSTVYSKINMYMQVFSNYTNCPHIHVKYPPQDEFVAHKTALYEKLTEKMKSIYTESDFWGDKIFDRTYDFNRRKEVLYL